MDAMHLALISVGYGCVICQLVQDTGSLIYGASYQMNE